MGISTLCKVIDTLVFLFLVAVSIAVPILDCQTCLPEHLFPPFLVEFKVWFIDTFGDYLMSEKPHFYVGTLWLELVVLWPLCLASVYGLVAGKSWFNTTCLMSGVITVTSMVAILSDMILSKKATDRMFMIYTPFLGLAILAVLRGMGTGSCKSATIGAKPAEIIKKRA